MEPMERRASPRRPIDLAAQMHWHSGVFACRIADFCAEGLFLKLNDTTSRELAAGGGQPRAGHEVTVSFREPGNRQEHRMAVRIARSVPGALGVAFSQPDMDAIGAMVRICGSQGTPERAHLRSGSDQGQLILRQCAREIIAYLEPLVQEGLGQLVDDLEAAAAKALNDQQANDFMDASVQVRSRAKPLWHQMTLAVESTLFGASRSAKRVDADELSLVDKGEFEDWLTLKVMVTKAETQYRAELLPLRMRLDKAGIVNSTGTQNALGPALICDAFRQGLQHLRLSRAADRISLRTFEERVLKHLEELYTRLNELLVHHGVLPDLNLSRYLAERQPKSQDPKPTESARKPAESVEPPEKPPRQEKAKDASSRPETDLPPKARAPVPLVDRQFRDLQGRAQTAFATVRNLMNTLHAGYSNASDAAGGAVEVLSANDLQRQLQSLQKETLRSPGTDMGSLRERVMAKIREQGDRALDPAQQSSLDVVDEFFDSLAQSPRLGDFARDQLRRLEVPIFKLVLQDARFFEDQDDPARTVMNRIAELGLKRSRLSPVVQRRIEALVQRINTEFEQDPRIFTEAQTELEDLIERQNLVYRRNVERVTAAAEGAQKVEESKRVVSRELDRRMAGRQVPRALVTLVNGGWRDLLSLTWIRQGPDSPAFQDYLAVIDTLLALAEDPATPVNLPELLRTIQEGLAVVSSNQMPPGHIRDELKRFLMNRHAGNFERVATAPVSEEARDSQEEQQRKRLQRWINRVHRLQVGDWLRYQDDPSDPQHMRLVWIGRNQSRFVFVNHQGMKVVEMELMRLAEQMQQGVVVPDPTFNQPLVDESIDRMVKHVYDQLSWASTHDELTGLLGRREFERVLLQRVEHRELTGEWVLAQLDLRQFRLLNDTAGFEAGDQIIRQVADLIRGTVTEDQNAARLPGDAYVLLLPAADAEATLYTLIHRIEALEPAFDGRTYHISASAGVVANPDLLLGPETWLRAVAEACVQSKKRGFGRVHWQQLDASDQSQREQIAARIAGLENLDEERLMLRCQKIIPIHSNAQLPTQYEVLISMYDDRGQLVSGADFVRMAERYQRMQAVDRWVVGHMLDWLRDHPTAFQADAGVCIKLSGHSLNDEDLLEFIYERLGQRDAPLERMWFEITEAAGIQNMASVAEFMEEVRELGCRFCLGNFGAGPSSYQCMRSLPVTMIKIDPGFVRDIVRSETDQAMVRSMVELAHFMGREVIAPQVEEKAALETLRSLGVDYAQGFAIEKPRLLSSLE